MGKVAQMQVLLCLLYMNCGQIEKTRFKGSSQYVRVLRDLGKHTKAKTNVMTFEVLSFFSGFFVNIFLNAK